jgi:hypothetical protein
MASKLKPDTLQALADWKAGKPVRSLELGHSFRMKEHPGLSPMIDESVRLQNDNERAHAYCFHIVEYFSDADVPFPADHETFSKACDILEEKFRGDNAGLTAEELVGAESLAWKAIVVGWRRAIDGHKEVEYVEVANLQSESKPQAAKAAATVNGQAL